MGYGQMTDQSYKILFSKISGSSLFPFLFFFCLWEIIKLKDVFVLIHGFTINILTGTYFTI